MPAPERTDVATPEPEDDVEAHRLAANASETIVDGPRGEVEPPPGDLDVLEADAEADPR